MIRSYLLTESRKENFFFKCEKVGTGKRKRLGETTGESELVSYEVALLGRTNVVTEKPNQVWINCSI